MSRVAVVTGATGFVGSELTVQLVQQGFAVRAVVRCSAESERAQALVRATRAAVSEAPSPAPPTTHEPAPGPGSLDLYQGDILDPQSPGLLAAMRGAHYVFHVASPFAIDVPDVEADLIRPAVEGTRNVVEAAAAHARPTLRRVVVTSSVAAVHDCNCTQPPAHGCVYTEDDFNNTSTPEKEGYWVSKVRGERAAWDVASAQGVDVVAILPEFVMGPPRTREAASSSLSSGFLRGFLEAGLTGAAPPSGSWVFSDVREVAAAHIAAAITPAAKGRYIVAHGRYWDGAEVAAVLAAALPELTIPAGKPSPKEYNLDNSKAVRELGLSLRDTRDTLVDAARALVALGLVGAQKAAA